MDVLVIDNYDSFTFNLVHYLRSLGARVTVWRNDEFDLEDADRFHKILLAPGPGLPKDAGLLLPVVRRYAMETSILGICLGQQAIAEAFGGQLVNLPKVYHGVASEISIVGDDLLFTDLPKNFLVGRYHSWSVARELPESLIATSFDANGEIMSLRHVDFDVRGVQFHPESIMTPHGKKILANWLAG